MALFFKKLTFKSKNNKFYNSMYNYSSKLFSTNVQKNINEALFTEYKPYELMSKQEKIMLKEKYLKEIENYYGSNSNKNTIKMSAAFENFAKLRRRHQLNSYFRPNDTMRLKVVKLRDYNDRIYEVENKNLFPFKIHARENYPELNFLVSKSDFYKIKKDRHWQSLIIEFVFPDGEEVRALYNDEILDPSKIFI